MTLKIWNRQWNVDIILIYFTTATAGALGAKAVIVVLTGTTCVAGVAGGVWLSSSGPEASGKFFTRSFKKSNLLSERIHCFLQHETVITELEIMWYTWQHK